MLIAIDHGNFAIKTVNHSFVAGLSEHTVKPPMTDEILEYSGKFWTLSGKRLSYMKDKTNHNDFEKLITLYDPLIDKHCFINGKHDDDLKQYLLMHLALNISKFII